METVAQSPAGDDLNLLTKWGDPDEPSRRRRALAGTLGFHAAAVTIVLLMPSSWLAPPPQPKPQEHHVTPIFMPLTTLTQRAPNKNNVAKEFQDADIGQRARPRAVAAPPAAPPAPAPANPTRAPVRQAVIPQTLAKQQNVQLPEAPKVDPAAGPKAELPQNGIVLPPPPKIQQATRAPLETLAGPPPVVPPDQRKLTLPDTSIDAAIRSSMRGNPTPPPAVPSVGQTPSMNLPQLLSDAQGVDFTPYLRQVLQIVRRNWNAVMPGTVRNGQQGKVGVVFSIDRLGRVQKLVIAEESGVNSFDRAAVAGVSASNPFPPLPSEFKGDLIKVQLNFTYNAPKQQ